jgi:hypothetical protein
VRSGSPALAVDDVVERAPIELVDRVQPALGRLAPSSSRWNGAAGHAACVRAP